MSSGNHNKRTHDLALKIVDLAGSISGNPDKVERITRRAAQIMALHPRPSPFKAMMLKHLAKRGGYNWTSLSFAKWPDLMRADFLKARAEAGDTRVLFFIRALNWPDIFEGQQPSFDFYDRPRRVVQIINEIKAAGMQPVPILMDNTESGAWAGHRERIVGGLKAWGHLVDEILLGLELNVFFGQFTMWGLNEEDFATDALLSADNGIKREAPNALWMVHYQPTRTQSGEAAVWKERKGADRVVPPVLNTPGADLYGHQFGWDSHKYARDRIEGEMDTVLAAVVSTPVVWLEFCQHNKATMDDALRVREWITEHGDGNHGS